MDGRGVAQRSVELMQRKAERIKAEEDAAKQAQAKVGA
jgi:hypothetical protein